jgi:hypothetical protein
MVVPLLPLLLAVGLQAAQNPPAAVPATPVTRPAQAAPVRKLFTESADARAQIAAAVAGAADDGIRVLVVWGSNDDERSANFTKVQRAPEISGPKFFSDEYKVVYVDVGKADRNLDVASAYGLTPAAASLPAFTVLDGAGKAVGRATAADFAGTDPVVLDAKKFGAFLARQQAPPPPDPQPMLNAAVTQAKKDGKYVFLWFTAPW